MKKIIVVVLTLISMTFIIPNSSSIKTAHADVNMDPGYDPGTIDLNDLWNYLVNNIGGGIKEIDRQQQELDKRVSSIEGEVDNTKVKESVKEAVDESLDVEVSEEDKKKSDITSFPDSVIGLANKMWQFIGYEFTETDATTESFGTKYKITLDAGSYTDIQNIFKTFGYSLVLVLFAVSLIESSIKYEIFTLKGGAMVFGRIMISKVIIDMSVTVCTKIIEESGSLSSQILKLSNAKSLLEFKEPVINITESNMKFIGPIINIIIGLFVLLPVMICAVCVLICAVLVMIKLILRSFELALLTSVAPAFFACASSETTKPYFKNFITTFLACSLQLVFMAVVLKIGMQTLSNTHGQITSIETACKWMADIFPYVIIIVAMTVMMIKPPKVLTGLVK